MIKIQKVKEMSKYEKLWWLEKARWAEERDINKLRLPDVLLQHHSNFRDFFVSFCPYCIVAPNLQLADRQSYLATLTPHTQDLAIYFTTDLAACSLFMDFESYFTLLGNHFRSKILADL